MTPVILPYAQRFVQEVNQQLEKHTQDVEHAVADSVARAAALGETWTPYRIVIAVVLSLVALIVLAAFMSELWAIKKAGGIKAYTKDFDTVNYGAVRGIWTCEIIVGAITVAIMLHAFVPKLVSELQVEAVVTLFGFAGLFRGINFGAFYAKRATQDPSIMATQAAINDPNVMPLITRNKKTGETTVSHIPVVQQPMTTTTTMGTPTATVETKATTTVEPPPPPPAPLQFAHDA